MDFVNILAKFFEKSEKADLIKQKRRNFSALLSLLKLFVCIKPQKTHSSPAKLKFMEKNGSFPTQFSGRKLPFFLFALSFRT